MKSEKEKILTAPVLALMLLGFALGSCEYVSIAVLPEVSAGLQVSMAAAGKMVGVFAAGYAIGTPIVMALANQISRKKLLLALVALFALANLISMAAPTLEVLYVARALAAIATGSLTAVIMMVIRQITPSSQAAKAISMVYSSLSLASVVGNPVCKLLCLFLGWRATFAFIDVISLIALPMLAKLLPQDQAPEQAERFWRQFRILKDRRYLLLVCMTICCYAATYVVYTFQTPIFTEILGAKETAVSGLLLLAGLCCLGSNVMAGALGSRGGVMKSPVVLGWQAVLLAAFPLLLRMPVTGYPAMFALCLTMYLLSTPVQLFAMDLAEREYPFAASLCSTTLSVSGNIGIAAGSFIGSGLQPSLHYLPLGWPAAAIALVGMGLNLLLVHAVKKKRAV